ncbi:MAG: ABC transporter permease [Armatimonadota bacterium]
MPHPLRRLAEQAPSIFFRYGILLAFILLCIYFAVRTPEHSFIKGQNLANVANQISAICIMALGMTFVIITAGIDLSVGRVAGLCAVVSAGLTRFGLVIPVAGKTFTLIPSADVWPAPLLVVLGVLAAIVVGGTCGACNAWTINRFRLPPFISTLAMMLMARGASALLCSGRPVHNLPWAFSFVGQYNRLLVYRDVADPANNVYIPVPVFIMAALVVCLHLLLSKTSFGRHVFAVGGNEEAARLSGIDLSRVRFWVYAMTGACAGVGGFLLASKLGAGDPKLGEMYELDAIAAVVLGGTSLMGGQGNIPGTVLGAFTFGVLNNGLSLMGVDQYWQWVLKGLVIIGAVMLDRLKK